MKRENIMTTYKNLLEVKKSFEIIKSNTKKVSVSQDVIEYAEKFGKKEAFLYNNRLYRGYINPSALVKEEHKCNWEYINSL
jgi:hypothetical protein